MSYHPMETGYKLSEGARKALQIVIAEATVGFPREIWEVEENLVREELLKTMDEMQKALIAASRLTPGENIREESAKLIEKTASL